jgi:Tfp pilus assembly protein PilF
MVIQCHRSRHNPGGVFYRHGKLAEAIPWLEKALALDAQLAGVPEALAHARAMTQEHK